MNDDRDQLRILAPRAMKPKLDYLHREVQRAAGRPISRRQALGLGGMTLFAAAAAGGFSNTRPARPPPPPPGAFPSPPDPPARQARGETPFYSNTARGTTT